MYKKAGSRSYVQVVDLRIHLARRTRVRYAVRVKRCTKCGVERPLDEFYKAAGTRDGLRGDCKGCFQARAAARYRANPEPARERAKQWARDNPDRVAARAQRYREDGRRRQNDRRYHLKSQYGLTVEQYEEMLAAQGGVCGICGRPPREDIALHVDHDHATGRVRGIVCFRCNNALGDFNDDPHLLEAASAYLDRHDPEVAELMQLAKQRAHALAGR